MALLRRTSSSRKPHESKNDLTRKSAIKASQSVFNLPLPDVSDTQAEQKLQCKKWIHNSFFNDTPKSSEKWTIEPALPTKSSFTSDINSNTRKSFEHSSLNICTNNLSSHVKNHIKSGPETQPDDDHFKFETKDNSRDSGLCTSTPKSKRKVSHLCLSVSDDHLTQSNLFIYLFLCFFMKDHTTTVKKSLESLHLNKLTVRVNSVQN